eukprot:Pgem_evm1s8866
MFCLGNLVVNEWFLYTCYFAFVFTALFQNAISLIGYLAPCFIVKRLENVEEKDRERIGNLSVSFIHSFSSSALIFYLVYMYHEEINFDIVFGGNDSLWFSCFIISFSS